MKADRMKLTSIIYVWFFMGGRRYVKIVYSKFKPSGEISNDCSRIDGVIATCLLDWRENVVAKNTAKNQLLGMLAKPFLSITETFAGNIKIPMKWISNMKAITNNEELASFLMKDKKSAGAMVPLIFLYTMLNPIIKVEPESFKDCPVLLVHPGEDRWTNIKLSNLFFDRLACEKKTVVLDGAGHFPIESLGLKQLESACTEFVKKYISKE